MESIKTNEDNPVKRKRNIIYFAGEKPAAMNLEHVTFMSVEGKRIYVEFYSNMHYVDMFNEEEAKSTFESLINTWGGDVLE